MPDLDAASIDLLRFIADNEYTDAPNPPIHYVGSPVAGWVRGQFGLSWTSEEHVRLWPFIWFPCESPARATDEAMLYDEDCAACIAEQVKRGYPEPSPLPPLADDAPILRGLPS